MSKLEDVRDPARRLDGLSPAKRKLFEMRLRGQVGAGAGPLQGGVAPSSSVLVDLRPERRPGAGDRPPFFCVHPIGGSVLAYGELASRLVPEQPFYGIQASGLTGPAGGPAIDDLPAMAAAYADAVEAAVEATASRGPYLLGGWSFGGVVAFEMARQLRNRGRRVGLVALLDSAAPALAPLAADLGEAEIVRGCLRDQADLQGLDAGWLEDEAGEGETTERLIARARETGVLKPSLRSAEVRLLLDVYRANRRAGASYRPEPYAGRLMLFRTLTSLDPTNGWEALAGGPVEVHALVADHYSLLALPVVAALAKRLDAGIARELDAAPEEARQEQMARLV